MMLVLDVKYVHHLQDLKTMELHVELISAQVVLLNTMELVCNAPQVPNQILTTDNV